MTHEYDVSKFLKTDVFGPKSADTLATNFRTFQNDLLHTAQKGDESSRHAASLFGFFYPLVYPELAQYGQLSLVDPRLDRKHPLNDLALTVQKQFLGEYVIKAIKSIKSIDGQPPTIIVTDAKDRIGYVPIIFNENTRHPDHPRRAAIRVGYALQAIHAPVNVSISGLMKKIESRQHPIPAEDIHESHSPLQWLEEYMDEYPAFSVVNAMTSGNPNVSILWKQLVISCPPRETRYSSIQTGSEKNIDDHIIQEWSLQRLLNEISRVSTQHALDTAGKLYTALSRFDIINPELTVLAYISNHAHVVTAAYYRNWKRWEQEKLT